MIHRDDLEKLSLALKQGSREGCYRVSGGSHMITIVDCPSACDALRIFLNICRYMGWKVTTLRVVKDNDPE